MLPAPAGVSPVGGRAPVTRTCHHARRVEPAKAMSWLTARACFRACERESAATQMVTRSARPRR